DRAGGGMEGLCPPFQVVGAPDVFARHTRGSGYPGGAVVTATRTGFPLSGLSINDSVHGWRAQSRQCHSERSEESRACSRRRGYAEILRCAQDDNMPVVRRENRQSLSRE